jgi:hypothetical protein
VRSAVLDGFSALAAAGRLGCQVESSAYQEQFLTVRPHFWQRLSVQWSCPSFVWIAEASAVYMGGSRSQHDGTKDIRFTVFKVLKPSSKGPAQVLTNRAQAPPIGPSALVTNRFFKFIHAFLARPFHSPFKMVAQKVEPSGSTGVYQSCFECSVRWGLSPHCWCALLGARRQPVPACSWGASQRQRVKRDALLTYVCKPSRLRQQKIHTNRTAMSRWDLRLAE